MLVAPHVERLARLLHNRVVRRVLSAHPTAGALLVVGDLVDGVVVLQPEAVWTGDGTTLADGTTVDPAALGRWRALVDDLRADLALLARVSSVELFVPYLLDLRQLDLLVESGAPDAHPAGDPRGD